MAKKKKQRRDKNRKPKPKATPKQTPADSKKMIEQAHKEALDIATDHDISAIGNDPKPDGADLEAQWEIVREARDIFRSAAERAEQAVREAEESKSRQKAYLEALDEREAKLDEREAELDARERKIADKLATVEKKEKEVAVREAELLDLDKAIRKREINAEVGFVAERKEMLAALEKSLEDLRETLTATEHEIAQKRKDWHEEEKKVRSDLQAELDTEREEFRRRLDVLLTEREKALDEREAQLAKDRSALEHMKRKLEFEEEDLQELRADLDKRVEQRVAAVREELEHRIHALEAQLQQARSDRDTVEEKLRQREEADRKFGQRTPDEVLAELDALRNERDELQAALAERPDVDAVIRLENLEKDQETWQAERIELRRQVAEFKRRLAYYDIDANERKVQRDLITSLESQRQLLFEAHRQIKSEIEELLSRSEAKSPFPACTRMDADSELQTAGLMTDDVVDLQVFVKDLQHRIAFDPDHPDRRLYYTLADLRSFLGGMAMSRLILLQGISGTGKTSLPCEFARAVGPPRPKDRTLTVVEVQAGWRDPQDLVGHYNVFEKRFYEEEFLKGLYRAQTPRWRDAIHIVLLDEMNLSHPEQYFSDMLSALELQPENRQLVLMPHAVDPAPALFVEGSKLPIPPNVWFVGTANHDETTKDFADKTYDRSHIQQFPHRPPRDTVEKVDEALRSWKPEPRYPLSCTALQQAFEKAIRQHQESADNAIEFLESEVRGPLAEYFEVGWGPRLERQMRRYVPVVVAAGGSVGEATDHVLTMRLLRKLKNRHDNRPEHLEALRQRIEESWPGLDKKSKPTRSVNLLMSEFRRLGLTPENGT